MSVKGKNEDGAVTVGASVTDERRRGLGTAADQLFGADAVLFLWLRTFNSRRELQYQIRPQINL